MQTLLAIIDKKKQKLDALRPLPPALVQNLEEWLSIEFTFNSNAIEGNTLSLDETALIVQKGITVGGKTINEHLEAINHAQAITFIKELSYKKKESITIHDIFDIHKIILQRIDHHNAGCLRKVAVRIAGSSQILPNYAKVPYLMDEYIQWLHTSQEHPIIIAGQAHLKLVDIHPFVDGNGRTARLLMNLILLGYGYPCAIIKKEDRKAYINAIQKALLENNLHDYYMLVFKAVEVTLDIYLQAAQESDLTSHNTKNK